MRYLEPRTDLLAKDDWSTGLILENLGFARRVMSIIALVAAPGVISCLFLPMTVGNVAAIVVLSLLVLFGAIGPLMHRVETLRCAVAAQSCAIVLNPDNKYPTYVQLPDGVVLESYMGKDLPDMVRERGEIFLCGPDEKGRAVLRVAGFAETATARVTRDENFVAEDEWERHEIGRPLDDPAVLKAFGGLQAGAHASMGAVIPAVIGVVVVLKSLWPIAPAGLVVGGLIAVLALLTLPSTIELGRWYRDAAKGVLAAQEWTPVPVTLFPWKPGAVVSGLATLDGGRLALVQFVDPDLHVIANIADTGVMWIAGAHEDVIAVGVPRVPVLTIAAVQPDSDTPREAPVPWIQRFTTPDFSGLPR